MRGLVQILRVSWTARRTNEWVLDQIGIERQLLSTIKTRKLRYFGHIMRKRGDCLEKEIMQGTTAGKRARGRPRTKWIENIRSWTGLNMYQLMKATENSHLEADNSGCGQTLDRRWLKTRQDKTYTRNSAHSW